MRPWSSQACIRASSQAVLLIRYIVTGSITPTASARTISVSAPKDCAFVQTNPHQVGVSGRWDHSCSRPESGRPQISTKRWMPVSLLSRAPGQPRMHRPSQLRALSRVAMSSPANRDEGEGAASKAGYTIWADDSDFSGFGLSESLVAAMQRLGYAKPTKIQAATIPQILAGSDVVMGAETGSGKTLSYGLPALHTALSQKEEWDDKPESLILVPNQELARQVALVLSSFGRDDPSLDVPITILAGSSGYVREEKSAIFIGTPSAVLRLTEPWQLDQVNLVIVDEADMLMDGGYVADLNKILKFLVPTVSQSQKRRLHREGKSIEEAELPRIPSQTVFAAATLPDWKGDKVKSVVRDIQKRFPEAKHISTEALHYQSAAAEHAWIDARGADRYEALLQVLREHEGERTMVFTGSVASCKEAVEVLEENSLRPLAIHKEVAPTERAEVLSLFREEAGRVLVCTDLVARGVDIHNVQHVVQLDFAATAMMHLHRVGRTARAGGRGHVTNILDEMSWEIGQAVKEEVGQGAALAPVFSRNRGFRRRFKRHGTGVAGRATPPPADA